ncbi:MAG: hypothetical protein A3E87_10290 [Gammaproteobacteria bacterium RIFCSPHIGHO2_12_FULL_35_23]|nr:MAG: hypothetical protein A3E87_10290 [Gammaproteobacteria bacterium RIFCSPHIGHO2_12_FULL_35_23]
MPISAELIEKAPSWLTLKGITSLSELINPTQGDKLTTVIPELLATREFTDEDKRIILQTRLKLALQIIDESISIQSTLIEALIFQGVAKEPDLKQKARDALILCTRFFINQVKRSSTPVEINALKKYLFCLGLHCHNASVIANLFLTLRELPTTIRYSLFLPRSSDKLVSFECVLINRYQKYQDKLSLLLIREYFEHLTACNDFEESETLIKELLLKRLSNKGTVSHITVITCLNKIVVNSNTDLITSYLDFLLTIRDPETLKLLTESEDENFSLVKMFRIYFSQDIIIKIFRLIKRIYPDNYKRQIFELLSKPVSSRNPVLTISHVLTRPSRHCDATIQLARAQFFSNLLNELFRTKIISAAEVIVPLSSPQVDRSTVAKNLVCYDDQLASDFLELLISLLKNSSPKLRTHSAAEAAIPDEEAVSGGGGAVIAGTKRLRSASEALPSLTQQLLGLLQDNYIAVCLIKSGFKTAFQAYLNLLFLLLQFDSSSRPTIESLLCPPDADWPAIDFLIIQSCEKTADDTPSASAQIYAAVFYNLVKLHLIPPEAYLTNKILRAHAKDILFIAVNNLPLCEKTLFLEEALLNTRSVYYIIIHTQRGELPPNYRTGTLGAFANLAATMNIICYKGDQIMKKEPPALEACRFFPQPLDAATIELAALPPPALADSTRRL